MPHLSDSGRCTAKDLGSGVPGGRLARQRTEYLVQACELGELWDDYGIVGDVEVSDVSIISYLVFDINYFFSTHLKPFTNEFPNAGIHELMAPDPLYQVIKGVFKDHLVVRDLVRAVHIFPVFDSSFNEKNLTFNQTVDKFKPFYLNKFIHNNSFWLVS